MFLWSRPVLVWVVFFSFLILLIVRLIKRNGSKGNSLHQRIDRIKPSLLVQLFNGVSRLTWFNSSTRINVKMFDVGALDGNESVKTAFFTLVASLNKSIGDGLCSPFGYVVATTTLRRLLRVRRSVARALRDHPEIAHEPLLDPVVIVGLARSGTTLLQRLLSLQQHCLTFLPAWELTEPVDDAGGRRWAAARLNKLAFDWLAPELSKIHPLDVDAAEEEILLLDLSFASQTFMAMFQVPDYAHWLTTETGRRCVDEGYQYMRLVLQLIQFQRRHRQTKHVATSVVDGVSSPGQQRRFLLKTPMHCEFPSSLDRVFPNALIVRTSRPVTATVPSFCSMASHLHAFTSDGVRCRDEGHFWGRRLQLMRRTMARHNYAGRTLVTVPFTSLIQRPAAVVRHVFHALGLGPVDDDQLRRAVHQFCTGQGHFVQRSRGRHPQHSYSLQQFGLSKRVNR